MKWRGILNKAQYIPLLFALLISFGASHPLLAASMMSEMGKQMSQGQCQISCTIQINTAVDSKTIDISEKDVEPHPVKPYYLAFVGIGWVTDIAIAAAYRLRYLRWRPPDLVMLHVAYRF